MVFGEIPKAKYLTLLDLIFFIRKSSLIRSQLRWSLIESWLLKNASVVIAFNSTIVFETIASNRNLIIPNFHNEYKYKKKFLHKVFTKKYFADSKNQFNKKIVFYLNTKYKNNQMTNSEKKVLSHYLGNTDGKSGKRMRKFLKNILRKN